MKGKTAICTLLLGLACAFGLAGGSFAGHTAYAGKTGAILADEGSFIGSELDYGEWRYNRNAGIGFREAMRCFAFDRMVGDDGGLKAAVPVPEGSGTAVEIEFDYYNVSSGGWAGLNYGSQVAEQSNGAFWDCYRDGSGKLHYFTAGTDGKLSVVFNQVGENTAGNTDYVADPSVLETTFYNGEGTAYQAGNGSFLVDAPQILENKTLREYYGADGGYELSIRDAGAPVSERKVLLRAEGIDPNPGDYIGLTYMSMRNSASAVKDFAAYKCSDADAENTAEAKIFGFLQEDEGETLEQFTLANQGAFSNLKAGAQFSIAFDDTSDIGNPLLNRTRVQASEELDVALTGSFTLKINELVGEKKFGAVFGVQSLSGDVGEEGTSYLYFEKDGDSYGYGLTYYGEQENAVIPFAPLPAGTDAEESIEVSFLLYADGAIDLSIGGESVYEGEAGDIAPEGYFGFAQSGNFTVKPSDYIDVEILSLNLRNDYYFKPAAPDVFTDFNNNMLNSQEWLLRSTTAVDGAAGLGVSDGALVFDGAGQNASITSRYSYSNFELRFDISGAQNKPIKDASGNITSGSSYWIAVTFGAETASAEDAGYSSGNALTNGSFLYFDAERDMTTGERTGKTTVCLVQKGVYQQFVEVPSKYAFFDADFDTETVVTIRVLVLDGRLSVGMKLKDEAGFTEVYSYEYENSFTPSGHVSIYSEGNQYYTEDSKNFDIGSTYKLDNLGLYNWDENGNVIDTDFTSNIPEFVGDYDYVDPWVYTEEGEGGADSRGCNGTMNASLFVPAAAAAAAALVIIFRKGDERK